MLFRSPDWPKPGILFYDITTLLKDQQGLADVIAGLKQGVKPEDVDVVLGIEARGFFFAPTVAHSLGKGFVPVRKPKKLPWETESVQYALEYGFDTLEIHKDAVKPGQRVLVHAAAGGVGGFAVQLARHMGAHVIATASSRNHDYLRGIGADEVIDYNTTAFETVVRDVDLVVDLMAGDVQARSWGVMKPGGMLVCALGPPDAAKAAAAGMQCKAQSVRPDGAQLREIGALIDAGSIKVEVAATFPLEKVGEAHRLSETGHVRGKIVLTA